MAGAPEWCKTVRRDRKPYLAARVSNGAARRTGRHRFPSWTSGCRQGFRYRLCAGSGAARNRLRHPCLCSGPYVGGMSIHGAHVRHRCAYDCESFRGFCSMDVGGNSHDRRRPSGASYHLCDWLCPLSPASLIPVAGIIIGNIMSGHTLACRRFFADLREGIGIFEAGLAVGFPRRDAIALVTEPSVTESVLPTVDRTATVGLVTLPGAFVGVLLGGGSALQAGAAQALVLIGILAGQAVTVIVAHELIKGAKLLPEDLTGKLHP